MRRTDIICAGLIFALGLVTIFYVIPNYVTGAGGTGELSPAFMPYVAAVLGTLAAVLLLVVRLVRGGDDHESAPLTARSGLFIGIATSVLIVTFVLLDFVGYFWGAAFIVAGFMILVRARVRAVVGTALAFPVALWLLFDRLLGFPLP